MGSRKSKAGSSKKAIKVLQQRAIFDIPTATPGLRIELDEAQAHHFRDVLRTKPGFQFIVVDKSSGREFLSEVINTGTPFTVELLYQMKNAAGKSKVSTIACALLKGDKNDLICEKAGELGAQRIIFFSAERSVVKLTLDQQIKRLERWHKIALGAASQSRRNFVPEVSFCVGVAQLVKYIKEQQQPSDKLWCCALGDDVKALRELTCPQNCHMVIGPEGDLSSKELELLVSSGFEPVSLGQAVLRAETAAIVAMAAVEALWGSSES